MTLSLKNSSVRNFYDNNIFAHAHCADEAIEILNKPSKALDYLEKFDEQFKTLQELFPTATEDIQAIKEMQEGLRGRVQTLIRYQAPTQTKDEEFFMIETDKTQTSRSSSASSSTEAAFDPRTTRPSSLVDFAPTGIHRPPADMNCGFNALFQCVMNTKHLPDNILMRRNGICKALTPLVNLYNEAQVYGCSIAEGLDTNVLRRWTAPAVSRSSSEQEDAFDIWQELADKLKIRPVIEQTVRRRLYEPSTTVIREPAIRLKLTEKARSFSDLIEEFFNTGSDDGARIERRFQEAPEVLVVQADRTDWSQGPVGQHNLSTPLRSIPEYFKTKSSWMAERRPPAGYALKGCVIQRGTLDGGHFISLQRKPDGWYLINDADVSKVTSSEAKGLLETGYLFFYEKADGPPPPVRETGVKRSMPFKMPKAISSACLQIPAWSLTILSLIAVAGAAYTGLA